MQHELDLARDKAETARSHGDSSSRQAQEDVAQAQDEAREWRARSEQLEEELRRSEDERRGLETLGSMSAGMGVSIGFFLPLVPPHDESGTSRLGTR